MGNWRLVLGFAEADAPDYAAVLERFRDQLPRTSDPASLKAALDEARSELMGSDPNNPTIKNEQLMPP